jgi:hypothetical protein
LAKEIAEVRKTPPSLVVEDLGKRAEVDGVAAQDDVFDRSRGDDPRGDRAFHGAQVRLKRRLGRSVDREGQPRPARVKIRQHGKARALDVLEDEHGPSLGLALELHHEGGDLVGGVDRLRDDHQLVGPPALDEVQVAPEILRHRGTPRVRVRGRSYHAVDLRRPGFPR